VSSGFLVEVHSMHGVVPYGLIRNAALCKRGGVGSRGLGRLECRTRSGLLVTSTPPKVGVASLAATLSDGVHASSGQYEESQLGVSRGPSMGRVRHRSCANWTFPPFLPEVPP
jgi:hypothetical protein